jgi:translation initiation factor IF-3
VETKEALARAHAAGLDLVEVAPMARPPVCRIMDYGKWKYAPRKKEQKSKSHRHESSMKEIRIKTPKIGDHDLIIKIEHARGFLSRGDRVQFSLRFRGRELAHVDEGHRIFAKIREDLSDCSKVDQGSRFESRRITMTLAPGATKKDKPAGAPGAPATAQAKPAATAPGAPPVAAAAKPAAAPAVAPAAAQPKPAAAPTPAPQPESSATNR